MDINITPENQPLIKKIVKWGVENCPSGVLVDKGEFSPEEVEELRRYLLALAKNNDDRVYGNITQGWRINLTNGATVGVGRPARYLKKFQIFYNAPFKFTQISSTPVSEYWIKGVQEDV